MHASADATVAGVGRNVLLFVILAMTFYWGVMYVAVYCPVLLIRVVFIIIAVLPTPPIDVLLRQQVVTNEKDI